MIFTKTSLLNEQKKLRVLRHQRDQLIKKAGILLNDYKKGIITQLEYEINYRRLFRGRTLEDYLEYYDSQIKQVEENINKLEQQRINYIPLTLFIVLSLLTVGTLISLIHYIPDTHSPLVTGNILGAKSTGETAVLSCEVTTNCSYYDILHLSNYTNAHAELPNYSNYGYKLCCHDTGPYNVTLGYEAEGTAFLHLANYTNSHVEQVNESNYSYVAYISSPNATISCAYKQSCEGYDTCLVSISTNCSGGYTNLHIADCVTDPYATKVCCNLTYNQEVVMPVYSNFSGNPLTTNFSAEPDLTSVHNLTLASDYGVIHFPSSYAINSEGENYNKYVHISYNLINVSVSFLDNSFNSSAQLTLYNLTFVKPRILKNGLTCAVPECVIVSYNTSTGKLVFNVSHFTAYSAGESVNLSIFDDTDSTKKVAGEEIKFYANYTYLNLTPINSSAGLCKIKFNESGWSDYFNMSYNSVTSLWQYNYTFMLPTASAFNVSCSGPESLTALDSINISVPTPTLISPLNNNKTLTNRTVTLVWNLNGTYNYELLVKRIYCNDPDYCSVDELNITSITADNYTTPLLDVDAPYNWTVRAVYNNKKSDWAKPWNFTIQPVISIILINSTVDFGMVNLSHSYTASDMFVLRNNGNVFANVYIKAGSSPFKTAPLNTSYFQYLADNTTASFNISASPTTFQNVSANYTLLMDRLNFTASNLGRVKFRITVPPAEPPGYSNTTIYLYAEEWP